jgi:hypothetical protein
VFITQFKQFFKAVALRGQYSFPEYSFASGKKKQSTNNTACFAAD